MGCRCDRRCGLISGAVFGALLAALGGILIPVGNKVIKDTVDKEAVIEPGTTAYDNWMSADTVVYRQFWLFDLKNPLEVLEHGAKPVVIERGPYAYKTRYMPKENITAFPNHTVSFLLPAGAIFDPSMSVGPEEDMITTLNLAVAGAYTLVPKFLHFGLEIRIKNSNASLFQRRTVKDLLWGYHDPLLGGTVGIFAPYNGTYDGPYNIFTGKDDISKVSTIDMFQDMKTVPYWGDTYCNMINGTDATSFAPFLDKKKPLFFFVSDICRSVSAEYESSQDLKGIQVYRYTLNEKTLAAPTINPDNQCYCKEKQVVLASKNCTVGGVLGVGPCRDGTPVYISLPHFLYGSPSLTEDVLGLSPSIEHHFTYLDVEPTTGFTLRFAKRLQVNMMYGPSNVITVLKKVKDYTIFPLVWLNETASLDDETADRFKKELLSRVNMLDMMQKSLIGLGTAIFVLCMVGYCMIKQRHKFLA